MNWMTESYEQPVHETPLEIFWLPSSCSGPESASAPILFASNDTTNMANSTIPLFAYPLFASTASSRLSLHAHSQ